MKVVAAQNSWRGSDDDTSASAFRALVESNDGLHKRMQWRRQLPKEEMRMLRHAVGLGSVPLVGPW